MNDSNDMKQATRELVNLLHLMADEASKLYAHIDEVPAMPIERLSALGLEYDKLAGHLSDAALSMSAIRELVTTATERAPSVGDPWEKTLERTRARAYALGITMMGNERIKDPTQS